MDPSVEYTIKENLKSQLADAGCDGFVLAYLEGDKFKAVADVPFGKLLNALMNSKFGKELLPKLFEFMSMKKQ
jgi:hypothetical protein